VQPLMLLKPWWHSSQIIQSCEGSPNLGRMLRATRLEGRVSQKASRVAPHMEQYSEACSEILEPVFIDNDAFSPLDFQTKTKLF
jgi:hypothetical protein